MNGNMKNFLEKLSEDRALAEKLGSEKDPAVIIAAAKELGIELNEADLKKPAEELTDDELDAIAGGGMCGCAFGGGGTKDSNDKACACVVAGMGYTRDGNERCLCVAAGSGKNT